MTIKLTDLLAPLEDMELPNGRVVDVRPFDAEDYASFRQFVATNDFTLIPPLVRRALPEATEEDLGTFTPEMMMAVLAHAQHKLDLVRGLLKNVESGPLVADTRTQLSHTPRKKPASSARSSKRGAVAQQSSSASASSPTT